MGRTKKQEQQERMNTPEEETVWLERFQKFLVENDLGTDKVGVVLKEDAKKLFRRSRAPPSSTNLIVQDIEKIFPPFSHLLQALGANSPAAVELNLLRTELINLHGAHTTLVNQFDQYKLDVQQEISELNEQHSKYKLDTEVQIKELEAKYQTELKHNINEYLQTQFANDEEDDDTADALREELKHTAQKSKKDAATIFHLQQKKQALDAVDMMFDTRQYCVEIEQRILVDILGADKGEFETLADFVDVLMFPGDYQYARAVGLHAQANKTTCGFNTCGIFEIYCAMTSKMGTIMLTKTDHTIVQQRWLA